MAAACVSIALLAGAGCGGGQQPQQQATAPAANATANAAATTPATRELPANGFRAQLSVPEPPTRLRAGQKETVVVRVKNASDVTWPMPDFENAKYVIAIGDNWLDAAGKSVAKDEYMDGRYGIQRALAPGEEVDLPLVVTAPASPGDYQLELDMVQEQVAWFREKGSQPLRLKVRVE